MCPSFTLREAGKETTKDGVGKVPEPASVGEDEVELPKTLVGAPGASSQIASAEDRAQPVRGVQSLIDCPMHLVYERATKKGPPRLQLVRLKGRRCTSTAWG